MLALFHCFGQKIQLGDWWKLVCIDQSRFFISYSWKISKIFDMISKYFSIFNNAPPVRWVAHLTRDFFFSIWVLFHEHSRITGLKGMGEGILLTPHYHFRPLHRHLDISRTITAESSPLRIASSRTRTRTFGFRAQVANH